MRKLPSSSPSSTASKSSASCCSKVGLKKGPWTPEEDAILSGYIAREGEGRWRTLPKRAGLMRCGKSCRLRWVNYLRPSVKRGHIAPDEEDLIIRLHRLLGNRWSLIAGRIPGRTDNEIKNYWNTHLSKRLVSQGIDPLTHKPMKSNPNSDDAPSVPKPDPEPNSSSSQEKESDENSADKDWITDPNYDGRAWLLQDVDDVWRNHEGPTIGYGRTLEDDDMGHCDEDVFSSFLNSLANEDAILQMQQQSVRSPLDHLVSSPLSFGCHAFREAAVSSPAATNGDYCRQDANQVDRQL